MKKFFYYILALFFYYTGDLAWSIINLSTNFYLLNRLLEGRLWGLYQNCMSLSLKYDEIAGYKIWKLPDET